MRYCVLVTDYLVTGQAETTALQAIERLRMSGRRALLVTGRCVDDFFCLRMLKGWVAFR
jgi:hypothetical protein